MEAIGTMAGGIAHDFNNLLNIISGNIDMIQQKNQAESTSEENVEHIKNAAGRAKNLVAQILAFSRQEQHDLVPVDIAVAVDDSLNLLRSTLPATVEIMTTVDVDTGTLVINADTTQLQQVFINLCTNAVHAMNGKGLLKIDLKEVEFASREIFAIAGQHAGRYAELSISDTGCGMDETTINKMFDPFFTTKGVGEGTGMGLSVVHGIIEQHGGFITVDSTPGHGATFNLYLPVISEIAVELKTKAAGVLPTGTESVLFVDDEESIAYTFNELLEHLGYKVTSVTSSLEALDIFKANPHEFDLVFTDQTMPGTSGAELATELLKIRPDIPIILCSGYSSQVSEEDAKGIGIREFCMKPMDMKQLATVSRKVLDGSGQPE